MLPDFERKLLRILVNYPMHRRKMPSMYLLEQKTGRSQLDIREGLRNLERRGFILWQGEPDTAGIVVIREEGESPLKPGKNEESGNTDYWTLY